MQLLVLLFLDLAKRHRRLNKPRHQWQLELRSKVDLRVVVAEISRIYMSMDLAMELRKS